MQLKAGQRLRSVTCATNIIVIRAPDGEVDLRCGGHPMVPVDAAAGGETPDPDLASGTEMGKRYEGDGLEVLCTKPGAGSLSVGTEVLPLKDAKPLPSSD